MDILRATSSRADSAGGSASIGDLAASIRGQIVTPGEPGWDAARQAWNLAVDQRPALVAMPLDLDDVRAIVQYARHHRLGIAPQGNGHSAGALGSLAGTILLSTRHMRGVEIDATQRIARVQAGTLWHDVTEATSSFGLYPLSGSSPDISVLGYTLGGGLNWLARQHGLACNQVTAIEVVRADGGVTRATPSEHTDLFWALRGGGGSFGVVTALEFALFPYREVYAGMFLWPYERRLEIMASWYAWTRSAPDAVTTSLRIMHFPPLDDLPPYLSGRSVILVDGAFAGDGDAGRTAVAGLRELVPELDTWGPASPAALSHLHMDPEWPIPFVGDSALLGEIDAAGARLDCSCSAAADHGRGTAAPRRRTVTCRRRRRCARFVAWRVRDPRWGCRRRLEPRDRRRARTAQGGDSCYETGALYPNFTERPADSSCFFTEADYARLQRIRAHVDPHELIVASHPITRSRSDGRLIDRSAQQQGAPHE